MTHLQALFSDRRTRRAVFIAGFLSGSAVVVSAAAEGLSITDTQALTAGKRLWKNECGGTVSGLTSWNTGEDFASLGIGHFIWYPEGRRGPFEESFPELLRFLAADKVRLPGWLSRAAACPWNSRGEFLAAKNDPRQVELREMLSQTVARQARFCANRLDAALPKMLAILPVSERERVRRQFYCLAGSPGGVYALVDYVNFKGEGVLATERYRDRGWGLLQVLAGMKSDPGAGPKPAVTSEFAASASRVLTERVSNSPAARGEDRWLPGWKNRVQTYSPGG